MSSTITQHLVNTFGGVPLIVSEHIKYFTYDEGSEEFTCIICDKVLANNKKIEAHIKYCHRGNYCSEDKVTHALTQTFSNKIPQLVKNSIFVLDVTVEGYKCVICNKLIKVSQDPKICVVKFAYHLTSLGHRNSLNDYYERVYKLEYIYGAIPEVVVNNRDVLKLDRYGKNYVCTLCNVPLKVYKNDMERTENLFSNHFQMPHHVWKSKERKVLLLIPELQNLNSTTVHTYLMRNIDYLSNNSGHIYCSLCHENIQRSYQNFIETEENLKHHILSSVHTKNMFSRQKEDNLNLKNLIQVNGYFTDEVLMNLRCLKLNDGIFVCTACDEEFYAESECEEVLLHLESNLHQSNVHEEEVRCCTLNESLKNLLSEMPQSIEENLEYVQFVQQNNFSCTLCKVTVPWMNLESHLSGKRHAQALEEDEGSSADVSYEDDSSSIDSLLEDFEYVFGEDYKGEMPECVVNNLDHIEYDGANENFHCNLCTEIIIVDQGNKKEEITWQNLRRHFLSKEHTDELKEIAKQQMEFNEILEYFFIGIPKCVLNNVNFLLENDDGSFYCKECDVDIPLGLTARTSAKSFLLHLRGNLHKTNIEAIETSIDNAFKYIDEEFGVPERLLRDIDFWECSQDDTDLYCTLCQLDLPVDLDDLKQTRWDLECHVDSYQHNYNLEAL